jgi:hypothetical protein
MGFVGSLQEADVTAGIVIDAEMRDSIDRMPVAC